MSVESRHGPGTIHKIILLLPVTGHGTHPRHATHPFRDWQHRASFAASASGKRLGRANLTMMVQHWDPNQSSQQSSLGLPNERSWVRTCHIHGPRRMGRAKPPHPVLEHDRSEPIELKRLRRFESSNTSFWLNTALPSTALVGKKKRVFLWADFSPEKSLGPRSKFVRHSYEQLSIPLSCGVLFLF